MNDEKILDLEARDAYNLFTDKSFQALYDKLPEEEKALYKKQGEYMYNKDYASIDKDLQSRLVESAAYIAEGMKSGLRPSQLEENEREVMRTIYGAKWYEKYFFTAETD
jgi:hypothetical protein